MKQTMRNLQAPWAMALTEAVVMPVLYVAIVREWDVPSIKDMHYSWWKGEEDVVLFSWLRALTAFISWPRPALLKPKPVMFN